METDSPVISNFQAAQPHTAFFNKDQLRPPSSQSLFVYISFSSLALVVLLLLVKDSYLLSLCFITEEEKINTNFVDLVNLLEPPLIIMAVLLWFLSIAAFCLWAYRVADNTSIMTPGRCYFSTPARHLGSYFIPVANFYIPYLGMKYIFKTTHYMLTGLDIKQTKIINNWWSLFWANIIVSVLNSISTNQIERMNENDITQEVLSKALKMVITLEAIKLAAIIATVWMVYKITREQMEIIKKGPFFALDKNL